MNIGIIGIGCIGSSLARDLKKYQGYEIYVHDTNPDFLEKARELSLAHHYGDIQKLASNCDLIFICVPVLAILKVIEQILPHMKEGSIVTDVGSVKSTLYVNPKTMPEGVVYIPGHPITSGTNDSGPLAGREDVFKERKWIITPNKTASELQVNKLRELLESLGANVLSLTANVHDEMLGFVSHLPHVMAFSAMQAAHDLNEKLDEDVFTFAGGSFMDLTRIAGGDPDMWRDIFITNKEGILAACALFTSRMDELKKMIENENIEEIYQFVNTAHKIKTENYPHQSTEGEI
tara:strand:- start:1363 stop:2235 length:873 start_codon:yes stop_codon:yes gene_type:complete